jgi:pimeloyl-ACP methyl ester carboxylesterase
VHQIDEIIRAGHIAIATRLLDSYLAKWPNAHTLGVLRSLMDGPGTGDAFQDDDSDCQIVRRAGCDPTLVVFSGRQQRFGISYDQLHHVWLSPLKANIVYLRDRDACLYLLGIRSLGDLEATIAKLGDAIKSLGTTKATMIGHSGGVFGALYYGARLRANTVLCFSGPSSLDIGLGAPNKQVYPILQDLRARGAIPWPDLRALVAATPSMYVRFFYGAENHMDTLQAEHLAGLQNVSLEPAEGLSEHFILDNLAKRGKLSEILLTCV